MIHIITHVLTILEKLAGRRPEGEFQGLYYGTKPHVPCLIAEVLSKTYSIRLLSFVMHLAKYYNVKIMYLYGLLTIVRPQNS